MDKVGVVIVNWNGKKYLKNCVESVLRQSYSNNKIFIVDNGSEDESMDVLKNYQNINKYFLKNNIGYAAGNNIAIKECLKDKEIKYLLFLNNDAVLNKNYILEAVGAMERYQGAGMISAKILFKNGIVNTIGLAFDKGLDNGYQGSLSIGYGNKDFYNREMEIFAPSGVAGFYRRKVIDEIGGFDENYFCYSEDVDLGFRARLYGWTCIFSPSLIATHYHSQSLGKGSYKKLYYIKRNHIYFLIKFLPKKYLFLYPFNEITLQIKKILNKKHKTGAVEYNKLQLIKTYIKANIDGILMGIALVKQRSINKKKIRLNKKNINKWFKEFNREKIEDKFI